MRLAAAMIVALALAGPALGQDFNKNGPDTTSDTAAQLDQQRRDAAAANQALRDGDYKAARRYAERLTNQAPKSLEAWLILGEAQRGLLDWKSARRTYAAAVRVAPASPEAHAGLGVARARAGDASAAKELEWFNERTKTCGATCGVLGKLKADVEAAIAAGPG